jgi:hypothetical protein
MLRLPFKCSAALAAAALLASTPSFAQGGLSGQLTDAGKQLDADIQACKPVSLGEYQALLNEAAKNKQRADKMAKKGVPVDQAKVDADLAAASALFNRATAALVQQCVRQAQMAPPPEGAMNLSPFAHDILVAHNSERAQFGAPPLSWDPALEQSAKVYAEQLARTGKLVHAPREGRRIVRENLSQGRRGSTTKQLLANWTKEKSLFVPGLFPNVSTTGNWYDVGHITQMIWVATTLIGCAKAMGLASVWLVCRYSPGGNKDGKPVGFPVDRPYLVETPKLPGTEVFSQNVSKPKTTVASDQGLGRTASLFDLGIYGGGAWTSDWFDIPVPDATAPIAPVPPRKRPSAWYVGGDFGSMILEDVEFDFGLQPTIPPTCSPGDSISPSAVTPAPLYPDGKDPVVSKWEFADTEVEAPALPPKEVFDPDEWKKTSCYIM